METLKEEREAHLQKRIVDTQYALNMDRARTKKDREVMKTIADAALVVPMDFWCRRCRIDFSAERAVRRVVESFESPIACYVARCPRCAGCAVRRITEKNADPFYLFSRRLERDRSSAEIDTLQPGQHGFETYYPDSLKDWRSRNASKVEHVERKHYDPSMRFAKSRELRRELRRADYRSGL